MKKKFELIMRIKIENRYTAIIIIVLMVLSSIISLSVRGISTNVDDFSLSSSGLSTQDTFWPGISSEWTEVAPEEQGLDSNKIAEMFEFIEDNSYDIHSVIITRNGYLLTEEYLFESQIYLNLPQFMYYYNGTKQYYWGKVHEQASGAKSVTSILIGIALQEGFLDNVNQTLYEFFADRWSPSLANSTLKKSITIEQLLTHNSGLVAEGPLYPPGDLGATFEDMIGWALNLPLIFNPGKEGEFHYSSDGPNLLSGIITNVTGKSMAEFAKEYLFEPLQVPDDEYLWLHDNQNVSFGGYHFQCSPKVQAKLGILAMNNGSWNGEQIVDKDYLKDATTDQTGYSCGYLWWMTDEPIGGYHAAGFGGQAFYVIPEYDIVVGFTAQDGGPYEQIILDYILQDIKPPPVNQIPEDQGIPDYYINLTTLTIFCTTAVFTTAVLIIRRKKGSRN